MSAQLIQNAGAASVRALLSPFGMGISRHVSLARRKPSEASLEVSRKVTSGAPLLVLSDTAILTSQTALDADADGLVPPPAEMMEMLHGDAVRLDEAYLAYYLSLRYFTKSGDWYAMELDAFSAAHRQSGDDGAASAFWERAAREHVSAPRPLFLAALRYVRASSFRKPSAVSGDGASSQPPALAVAPVLDVVVRSTGKANASLAPCTAKDVAEKYLSEDLRGARQALLAKDDACAYWVLVAQDNIPEGDTICLSSQLS